MHATTQDSIKDLYAQIADIRSKMGASVIGAPEVAAPAGRVGSGEVVRVRVSSAAALLSRWDEKIEDRKRSAGMMTCADLVDCARELRRLLADSERAPAAP